MKGISFVRRRYTKGVPFLSKMVYKRVGCWTSGRSPPRIKLCWVPPLSFPGLAPGTLRDKRVQRQEKKHKRQFTLRTSWKLVSSIKEKKLLEMNRRHDSWIEETATWMGSVHLSSGVQEEILSQWFSTSMAEEITCKQVCLMSKV